MPRQVVQYDFSGGVDQRTDARHVVPGKLTSLVNGQYDKDGSIRKRRGFSSLSRSTTAGATLSAAKHLTTLADELVLLDGTSLHTWSTAATKWVTKDVAQPFALDQRQNVAAGSPSRAWSGNSQGYVAPDIAYAGGFHVVSWLNSYRTTASGGTDRGEPTITVLDATTGAQVLSNYSIEGSGNAFYLSPRMCATSAIVFIVYANITGDIFARTYTVATQTLSAATTIATDARNAADLSYAVATDGTSLFVVYENDGTGTTLLSYTVRNSALASVAGASTVDDLGYAGPFTLATCVTSGESWWIVHGSVDAGSVALAATARSPSTYAQTVAGYNVDTSMAAGVPSAVGVCRVSSSVAMVTLSTTQAGVTAGTQVAAWRQCTTGGVTSGALRKAVHAQWASKPVTIGSRHYAWAYYYSALSPDSEQETMIMVDLLSDDVATSTLSGRPVAAALPRIALRDTVSYTASDTLASVVTVGTKAVTVGGWEPFTEQRALDLVTVETSPKYTSAEMGQSLYLSGGFPAQYDGARVTEAAFLTYPETPQTLTSVNGSGTLTNLGVYSYALVATWTNAKGEVMRSQPSEPASITLGAADDTVRFWLPHLPFTLTGEAGSSWVPNATFEVYRTTNGGATYYRVPFTSIYEVSSGRNGPIVNDPTAHAYQYEDRAPDTALAGQPILYTTGGLLGSLTPPGSSILCAHKERLFLADGKDVWFTSQRNASTDGQAPRWNELWRFTVEDGGPITALASNGQWLVAFKRDKVFVIGGDGPGLDAGTGQDFAPPQRVASDVGCIEPRSVAVTPAGVVFQSAAGIYLLSGGGAVTYISGPVEDTLADNPTITSVTVHESLFQVRFSCNSSGTTGVVLVWDYQPSQTSPQGRWSTFQFYDGTASLASAAIAGSCNSRGVYHWVATNGQAYEERATSHASAFLDGSQWITLSLETAWFKFGGLQGYQRVWAIGVLGDRYTDHDIGFQYAVDYSASYEAVVTTNVQSSLGLEQFRYVPRKQKGEAIRVKFADATPSSGTVGSGRALSLTGLAFEVKVLPKIQRLPSTKRA